MLFPDVRCVTSGAGNPGRAREEQGSSASRVRSEQAPRLAQNPSRRLKAPEMAGVPPKVKGFPDDLGSEGPIAPGTFMHDGAGMETALLIPSSARAARRRSELPDGASGRRRTNETSAPSGKDETK